MTQVIRLVQATLVNAVTVYGVFGAHWTVATAIAIYWCENVLAIVFISLLLTLYPILTRASNRDAAPLNNFLGVAVPFTIAHGIALAVVLLLFFPRIAPAETFDLGTFAVALVWIAAMMLFNFLVDVSLFRVTSFADLSDRSQSFMGRVVVVHLTIFLGMGAMMIFGHARALFAVFAALKFLGDLSLNRRNAEMVRA